VQINSIACVYIFFAIKHTHEQLIFKFNCRIFYNQSFFFLKIAFLSKREANDGLSDKQDDYNHEIAEKPATSSSDKSVESITVKVGQTASLPCFVANLGSHKVGCSHISQINKEVYIYIYIYIHVLSILF
jgi:hypothetical protein